MPEAHPLLSVLSSAKTLNPLHTLKPEIMKLAAKPDGPAKPVGTPDPDAQLRKVAEDFEGLFMGMVIKQMRSTVHREEFLNGGIGEEIFTELLDEELGKGMAGRSASGIADMLYNQLKRTYGTGTTNPDAKAGEGMLPLTAAGIALQQQMLKSQGGLRSLKVMTALPEMP